MDNHRMPTRRRKSPTAQRRLLALTLRELADAAGLSSHAIAGQIDHDPSWVTKALKGDLTPHSNDVRVMLSVLGIDVDGPQGQAIVEVARQANRRGGWWQNYKEFTPEWFSKYIGLESEAAYLRTFEAQAIPGLLQTEEYARATLQSDPTPGTVERIEKQVELRLARQELLEVEDPPQLRVVLDEGVLRRLVGGRDVMRRQIEHLAEIAERPNVSIQVLPFLAGAHSGYGGPFVILEFPPPPAPYPDVADPKIVYVDLLTGAHYFELPHEIAAYEAAWDGLVGEALGPDESRRLFRTMANDLERKR